MPTNADLKAIMSRLQEEGHHGVEDKKDAPVVPRGVAVDVAWQTFNPNMQMTPSADGKGLTFSRIKYFEYDAALGQAIESGRHEWTVTAPHSNANNYVGVASEACDQRTYPAATSAWTMYMHDGALCSGSAASPSASLGFTRKDGTRGFLEMTGRKGSGARNPEWTGKRLLNPIPVNTPIHVILDMEERTLAFAVGDAEPQIAFTHLPASVHPYVASGEIGDRSRMEVSGGVHAIGVAATAAPAAAATTSEKK